MSNTPNEFSPDLNVEQETLLPFDVREPEGLNPLIKLAILAAGLLLLAFIVLKLYTPGVRDRSDPPRITADNTPFKVKPDDIGGVQTPNQDKVVFEVMDGKSPNIDTTPEPLPGSPAVVTVPANGHSDWVVQVSSTRSQEDARDAWSKLKGKFPRLVDGKYGDVVRVDLGDKGIYYRTRVAGLADKSSAQSLCNSLKASGQACFVAKK